MLLEFSLDHAAAYEAVLTPASGGVRTLLLREEAEAKYRAHQVAQCHAEDVLTPDSAQPGPGRPFGWWPTRA